MFTGISIWRPVIVISVVLLAEVACVPQSRWDHTPQQSHVVRTGETLFTIAFRYGHDYRELARWSP